MSSHGSFSESSSDSDLERADANNANTDDELFGKKLTKKDKVFSFGKNT